MLKLSQVKPYPDFIIKQTVWSELFVRGGQRVQREGVSIMALSKEEIARYKRHLLLKEVGGQGQQKLKEAKVLVIGAGGLGSPVLLYLAAAGVGTLGIIDDDHVSLDNLQRQIIHDTDRVDVLKTASAAWTIKELNPHIKIETYNQRITAANAMEIISQYDIVADGCDNFATRYLVSDACFFAKKTLVSGAVGPFDGQLATFKPHMKTEKGVPFPSYRCIFPEAPDAETVLPCSAAGVLGALVGVIGSLQALEVLKEILGIGDSLAGRLLLYDALSARFTTINVKWSPNNPLTGEGECFSDLGHFTG